MNRLVNAFIVGTLFIALNNFILINTAKNCEFYPNFVNSFNDTNGSNSSFIEISAEADLETSLDIFDFNYTNYTSRSGDSSEVHYL
jgi:hypothetical protein